MQPSSSPLKLVAVMHADISPLSRNPSISKQEIQKEDVEPVVHYLFMPWTG